MRTLKDINIEMYENISGRMVLQKPTGVEQNKPAPKDKQNELGICKRIRNLCNQRKSQTQ